MKLQFHKLKNNDTTAFWVFLWGDADVVELVQEVVAQHWECAECHWGFLWKW